jgi:hypothetical protein
LVYSGFQWENTEEKQRPSAGMYLFQVWTIVAGAHSDTFIFHTFTYTYYVCALCESGIKIKFCLKIV